MYLHAHSFQTVKSYSPTDISDTIFFIELMIQIKMLEVI